MIITTATGRCYWLKMLNILIKAVIRHCSNAASSSTHLTRGSVRSRNFVVSRTEKKECNRKINQYKTERTESFAPSPKLHEQSQHYTESFRSRVNALMTTAVILSLITSLSQSCLQPLSSCDFLSLLRLFSF